MSKSAVIQAGGWVIESDETGMVMGQGRTEKAAWRDYRRCCREAQLTLSDPVAVQIAAGEKVGLCGGMVCRYGGEV